MKNNQLVKLENISKIYDLGKFDAKHFIRFALRKKIVTKKALNNISIDIFQNERVALIGDNGAGKSTLLKVIAKITFPNKGIFELKGTVCSLLEAGVGFHPELNGIENIYLNGAILGMSRSEVSKKINRIIKFSEINKEQMATPVKRYSTGMTIKLALSIILNLDAHILIMDEIMAVIDNNFKKKCINEILRLVREKKTTLLFVSHQLDTVQKLCKRGILMDNGRIIMDGEINKVISYYKSLKK